jgi:hypothetical protein
MNFLSIVGSVRSTVRARLMPTDVVSIGRIIARALGALQCFSNDVGPSGQCVRRDRRTLWASNLWHDIVWVQCYSEVRGMTDPTGVTWWLAQVSRTGTCGPGFVTCMSVGSICCGYNTIRIARVAHKWSGGIGDIFFEGAQVICS